MAVHMKNQYQVRRALISVSDKTGIVEFAKQLHQLNIEILSTGGTFKTIASAGIPAIEVSQHTNFPEMLDGRVKTLHPKIHGGILARRGQDDETLEANAIEFIDLVVVNLYPFRETIAKPNCTLSQAIEQIDIGGPTMIRAAAKNHKDVLVVVDPDDYTEVTTQLSNGDCFTQPNFRFKLALKAFQHTASYDSAISDYLFSQYQEASDNGKSTAISESIQTNNNKEQYPETLNLNFEKIQTLRYGENPHQTAAFYREQPCSQQTGILSLATSIQGKPLSYNNIADTDAALECVKSFSEAACVIVKHANPCGVAIGSTLTEAYERAYQTDPTSAFGGIIAFNRPLDAKTAKQILANQFVEVIIAPSIPAETRQALAEKPNIRALECGNLPTPNDLFNATEQFDLKRVSGGILVQSYDAVDFNPNELQVVTKRQPSEAEMADLKFCWKVAKFVKSNAIVYAKGLQTVGIGAGQMSRVYSAKIAAIKAQDEGLQVPGSAMASDAFFPFRDGIDAAAEAGITAVIQPGGSKRDAEVIMAADEANIAMVFTGIRHFKH